MASSCTILKILGVLGLFLQWNSGMQFGSNTFGFNAQNRVDTLMISDQKHDPTRHYIDPIPKPLCGTYSQNIKLIVLLGKQNVNKLTVLFSLFTEFL